MAVLARGRFETVLARRSSPFEIPLLVLRFPELRRIAWLQGRAQAKRIERACVYAFANSAAKALRRSDVLVHDASTEDFLVALMSSRSSKPYVAGRTGYRAILDRLGVVFEEATGLLAQTGWTELRGAELPILGRVIEHALETGRLASQRYAFFSAVGHELRTPLTSIRGYLAAVRADELDDPTRRRFLEIAESEAVRLARLLDGLFEISLLDLNAGAGPAGNASVTTAIAKSVLAVEGRIRARGISISQSTEMVEVRVAMAEDRLMQVVINLLVNAIEHGRENGVIALSSAVGKSDRCVLAIEDDGEGVADHERDLIFKLGQRGSSAVGSGTGIGLAIARLMLERVDGEIDVDDSPLGGARFRISLPIVSTL